MPKKFLSRGRLRGRRIFKKRLPCYFCKNPSAVISYKNVDLISRFLTSRGKIIGRVYSGTCTAHQRALAKAIKRARVASLVPYTESHAIS